jgi:hypothetical protein
MYLVQKKRVREPSISKAGNNAVEQTKESAHLAQMDLSGIRTGSTAAIASNFNIRIDNHFQEKKTPHI